MAEFNNPWAKGGKYWPGYDKNPWAKGGEKASPFYSEEIVSPFSNTNGLAKVAEAMGARGILMDHYYKFQENEFHWFFSPNPHLESATGRPKVFSSWVHWDSFPGNQKRTLASLSGFLEDATDIVRNKKDLAALIEGYRNWPNDLYSVFWGNENSGTWTCNIFVGDAIYLWKMKSVVSSNRHYFDPQQIKSGKGPFKKVEISKVQRGCIVVFGSHHVEIVTKLKSFALADDGFCSIGAGRWSKAETGTTKCDAALAFAGTREVGNKENTFYFL